MTPEEKVLDLNIACLQAEAELLAITLKADSYRIANEPSPTYYGADAFRKLAMDANAVAAWVAVLRGAIH